MRTTCRTLRSQYVFPTVLRAIAATNRARRAEFRICHFSVQRDHIHLIVEAESSRALSNGVKSLACRLAYHVNRLVFGRGPLIAGRFHSRDLETRRAVRNALVYVLGNFRKHAQKRGEPCTASIDPFSSAPYFASFRGLGGRTPIELAPHIVPGAFRSNVAPIAAAETWLLARGWISLGEIFVREAPRS
jgi:REP element-mobilizing transposase RayT